MSGVLKRGELNKVLEKEYFRIGNSGFLFLLLWMLLIKLGYIFVFIDCVIGRLVFFVIREEWKDLEGRVLGCGFGFFVGSIKGIGSRGYIVFFIIVFIEFSLEFGIK